MRQNETGLQRLDQMQAEIGEESHDEMFLEALTGWAM